MVCEFRVNDVWIPSDFLGLFIASSILSSLQIFLPAQTNDLIISSGIAPNQPFYGVEFTRPLQKPQLNDHVIFKIVIPTENTSWPCENKIEF